TAGSLYAYNFAYDSANARQVVTQQNLLYSGTKRFVSFSDERILLGAVSGNQSFLHVWYRTDTGFTQSSVFPISVPLVNTSSSWDIKGEINADWLFLLNYRNGSG